MLLMPTFAGVMIDTAGERHARLLPGDNIPAAALVVGAQRTVVQTRIACRLYRRHIVAQAKERQRGAFAVNVATAPGDVTKGGKLAHLARQQLFLIDTAHGARGNAGLIVQRAGHHQAVNQVASTLAQRGIIGQLIEREQANIVYRVIRRRIPLHETLLLNRIKPGMQALGGDRLLFTTATARSGKEIIREHLSGEVLSRVEAQRVILAPVPHHVVAQFVIPVAIAHDGGTHALPQHRREVFAVEVMPDPQQRHHREIRAVLAGADSLERAYQQLLHLRAAVADVQHRQ